MSDRGRIVVAFARREVETVGRTYTFFVLALGFAVVLLGVARVGSGAAGGYLPTTVDLLTPLELLVPVVAVAFGYRAILADARRGELDVVRTYPVAPWQLVLGTYLGRAVGLLVAIVLPLLAVGFLVVMTSGPEIDLFATHAGADSPVLFLRVIVLTALFGLVVLSLALAVSAVATSTRSALALATLVLLVVIVGADLAILAGLTGDWFGDDALQWVLALSPNSAYRGLVLETVVGVAIESDVRAGAPLANLLGLVLWVLVGLVVATVALGRR